MKKTSAVAVTLAMGLLAQSPAEAFVMSFAGPVCTGLTTCANGDRVDRSYGDQTGLSVGYRSTTAAGNAGTTVESYLKWWAIGYGDLSSALWGGTDVSHTSELSFVLSPGYSFTLENFWAAGFPDSPLSSSYRIYDLDYNLIETFDFTTDPLSHLVFTPNRSTTTGLILQWDNPNIGIDHVEFSVQPVPLPASVLLLGSAIAGLAGFRRRQRRAD